MVNILKSVAPKLVFICIFFASMILMSQGLGYLCHLDAMPLSEDSSVPAGYDLSYWTDVKATQVSPEELAALAAQTEKNSYDYKKAKENREKISVDQSETHVASNQAMLP